VLVLIAVWILPVLFVGGILAAIALPAYQDYAKRAQQLQKK
jgi:Tfp pilus assembly major pilin PilA